MNRREKLIVSFISIIFFSIMYYLCEILSKGKSIYKPNTLKYDNDIYLHNYLDCLHFSIITQCTIGYGNIYAISTIATMLVNIQCLTTLYIIFS